MTQSERIAEINIRLARGLINKKQFNHDFAEIFFVPLSSSSADALDRPRLRSAVGLGISAQAAAGAGR
jgi:hypothetical protein